MTAIASSLRPGVALRSLQATRWPVVLPVLLMVVSDFDFRQRLETESLSGRPDVAVLFEVAVYGIVGLFLLNVYIQCPSRVRTAPAIVALWGFGVTMMVSAILAPYPTMGIVRGGQLLVMCLLAAMLASWATREHVGDTFHLFVIVVAAAVAFGVVFPFPAVSHLSAGRFTWLYVHPTISGVYLAIAFVIALGLSLRPAEQVRWARGIYLLLAFVFAFSLYKSQTRGSIAGAVVGAIVIAIASSPRRNRPGRILTVVAGAVLIVLVAGGGIARYLAREESTETLATLNSRTQLWTEAWRFYSERPVSGWGLGATRGVFLESTGLGGGHNAFVNVLVDGGLAGVVWWVATILCVIVATWKLARVAGWRDEVPIMAGILALLLVNSVTVEGLGAVANISSMWLITIAGWTAAGLRTRANRRAGPPVRPPARPAPV
ncbi:MAG: O-antigen ligase family protein, partial [Acidimicrobiia bacterium]